MHLNSIELSERDFEKTLNDGFDGLTVVEFWAPWCATCRGVAPTYDRMVGKVMAERKDMKDVRFFKVNFKENKALSLRERVFALPAVHFYTQTLGRVNRFTLTRVSAAKRLRYELARYLGDEATGSDGHLSLLKSLRTDPAAPLVRYTGLVSVLQALASADAYIADAKSTDGELLGSTLEEDGRRVAELTSLFQWIDANSDGVIDADELAAVAKAVSVFSGDVDAGRSSADDLHEVYVMLLEKALSAVTEAGDAEDEEEDEAPEAVAMTPSPSLTLDEFLRLMNSKAVAEFRVPEEELSRAFGALDDNSDGVISREELLSAMQSIVETMPPDPEARAAGRDWAADAAAAFDALDRDQSGTLDYEEFVAMLSGTRATQDLASPTR